MKNETLKHAQQRDGMPSKPKLTQKQAKFVRGIAEGKTNTDAALAAYDTVDYGIASSIATENLKKPSVQEAVEYALVKLNITPERAIKPIDDALNDDDVKTRLMGSDRAIKLMGIGQKSEGNVINNFGNMQLNHKSKYDL
jgi:hypothetical protein